MFSPEEAKVALKKILEQPEFKRQIEILLNPNVIKHSGIFAPIAEMEKKDD